MAINANWKARFLLGLFGSVMNFFVVALLIEKSLEMFASLMGIWIPFALIFASTYLAVFASNVSGALANLVMAVVQLPKG